MGKSRRHRANKERSDPLSKPTKPPPTDPELAALREKSILPVLRDLQSSTPKSRTAAAGAVANIVTDTRCRKLLLREQVVQILFGETLTDASLESRAAGWEILRVLTAEEEADFCVHLYRVDVLSAIQHACAKITEILTSSNPVFNKRIKAEQGFIWSIAESLTAVLSAVTEAQDEALESVVQNANILRFLFTVVSNDATIAPALNGAISCMITLSEDSQTFVEAILADNGTQCYKHLVTLGGGDGYEAVLACGVLHNVFAVMQWNDQSPGKDGASDAMLIPTLARTLAHTCLDEKMTNGHSPPSPADIVQLALEILASIGTSLQESLEKGSAAKDDVFEGFGDDDITMGVDGPDDSDGEEDDGDDDELHQDEMEADMEMVTGAGDDSDELSGIDDLPTLRRLIQEAIPAAVKVSQANINNEEISLLIRTHALTTLNNIAWTVSCIDFTEQSNATILRAWTPSARSIWKDTVAPVLASDTSDVELATIVTSLAWAIARTLHEQTILEGNEHKRFVSLYHASRGFDADQVAKDPFQGLGVKCIGVLGQLALDAPLDLNREIGIFLLTVTAALPETPAADAVEALNQLFDIYCDENKTYDKGVFWRDDFLRNLEEIVPKVKAMVKHIDKRKSTELRTRAEEASINLDRLIQYKKKHRP